MGCDCNSEVEILERLRKIRDKNKNKTILVTSHHPFIPTVYMLVIIHGKIISFHLRF